ncbi:MAG: hypothetical protein ACK56I_09080, partial [bacterium]
LPWRSGGCWELCVWTTKGLEASLSLLSRDPPGSHAAGSKSPTLEQAAGRAASPDSAGDICKEGRGRDPRSRINCPRRCTQVPWPCFYGLANRLAGAAGPLWEADIRIAQLATVPRKL